MVTRDKDAERAKLHALAKEAYETLQRIDDDVRCLSGVLHDVAKLPLQRGAIEKALRNLERGYQSSDLFLVTNLEPLMDLAAALARETLPEWLRCVTIQERDNNSTVSPKKGGEK